MGQSTNLSDVTKTASAIDAEIKALSVRNTPSMRAVRRKYSRALKQASPDFVLRLARRLREVGDCRWFAYELIQSHPATFERLDEAELEDLGQGINSWWTVDAFARTLSGPVWLNGQVPDKLILKWARSKDRWWRRAALVSTVALNVRSHGGKGDTPRTLRICRVLVNDHDDMVAKAMSWALRELVAHDVEAVRRFLNEYVSCLHSPFCMPSKNALIAADFLTAKRRHRSFASESLNPNHKRAYHHDRPVFMLKSAEADWAIVGLRLAARCRAVAGTGQPTCVASLRNHSQARRIGASLHVYAMRTRVSVTTTYQPVLRNPAAMPLMVNTTTSRRACAATPS
jgi:3-methyladenine DNA glycosylase AlkD